MFIHALLQCLHSFLLVLLVIGMDNCQGLFFCCSNYQNGKYFFVGNGLCSYFIVFQLVVEIEVRQFLWAEMICPMIVLDS